MRHETKMLLLVAALLPFVACTSSTPDEEGGDPTNLPPSAVGDCLDFATDAPETVETLPFIGCEVAHSHQIFGVVESKEPDYPGFDALEEFAQVECLEKFEEFVGISAFDSSLFYSWIVPSLGSWNSSQRDRQIICVAGSGDGRDLIGTIENSRI